MKIATIQIGNLDGSEQVTVPGTAAFIGYVGDRINAKAIYSFDESDVTTKQVTLRTVRDGETFDETGLEYIGSILSDTVPQLLFATAPA